MTSLRIGLIAVEVIKVCGDDASTSAIEGTFKVLRFWTCLDWCTGETATHLQIIKVGDHGSPVVACPLNPTRALQLGLGGAPGNLVASEGTNVTLSTDYNSCMSAYNFPAATFTDACGSAIKSGWLIGTDATSGAEAYRINTLMAVSLEISQLEITMFATMLKICVTM